MINQILKDAKIEPRILRLINEEAMCETFHKLPSEIREMDLHDYRVLCAILQGKQEGQKKK